MRRAMFDGATVPDLLDLEMLDAPDRQTSSDSEAETGRDWLWRGARGEGEDDQ